MNCSITRPLAAAAASWAVLCWLSGHAVAQQVDSDACSKITATTGGWLIETASVLGSPDGGQMNPACATIADGVDEDFRGQVDSPCSVGNEFSGVSFTVDVDDAACTVQYHGSICNELSPMATVDYRVNGLHSRWINAYSVITGVQLAQNGTLNSGTHELVGFDDHTISFRATASGSGGFNALFTDPFVYTVQTAHTLVNDDCTAAQLIAEGTWSFTNVGATTDGPPTGPACSKFAYDHLDSDVWFEYQAPEDGMLSVSTCATEGSFFDTKLAVYQGDSCAVGTFLGCNEDACGEFGFQSMVEVPVVAGQSYLIRVGGYFGDQGEGMLTVTLTPDECPGDANGDGVVNTADLLTLLANWGPCP